MVFHTAAAAAAAAAVVVFDIARLIRIRRTAGLLLSAKEMPVAEA